MGRDPLTRKIQHKRGDAKRLGQQFSLSRLDIEAMLEEAGIGVGDWSISKFHLARFGDKGGYTPGNCRFISAGDNVRERRTDYSTLPIEKIRERLAQVAHLDPSRWGFNVRASRVLQLSPQHIGRMRRRLADMYPGSSPGHPTSVKGNDERSGTGH